MPYFFFAVTLKEVVECVRIPIIRTKKYTRDCQNTAVAAVWSTTSSLAPSI